MGEVANGTNISVFVKDTRWKSKTIVLKDSTSVDELYREVAQRTGRTVQNFNLLFTKYQLEKGSGRTLADEKIQNGSTVYMVMILPGGTSQPSDNFEVVYDNEEDLLTLERDITVPKAKMPCGHSITKESMTSHCRDLLKKKESTFLCPGTGCNKEIPYSMVRRFASLSPGEQKEFETQIAENYSIEDVDIRQCPGCDSYCQRQRKSDNRIKCFTCSEARGKEYSFCWDCQTEWGTRDHTGCRTEFVKMFLNACKTKKIAYVDIDCPTARACPNCFALIQHKDRCKHMTCLDCKVSFCFICLKRQGTDDECGVYNTKCKVAPTQTTFS